MASGPKVGFLERYGVALAVLGCGTLVLLVVLLRGGVDTAQVLRVYFLAAGCVVLYLMVQRVRRLGELAPFISERRPPAVQSPLPLELEQLQNSLRASRSNRAQFDLEVVPILRRVAEDRLRRSGDSLAGDPRRAARRLSPRLRGLLLAEDVSGPGQVPDKAEMAELVEELRRLGA